MPIHASLMWHGSYDGITGCSHQKEKAGSVTINK